MVRVERLAKASRNDNFIIRFREQEWQVSQVSFNLEIQVRERFGQVAPEEVVEIRPPRSHEVLYLKVKELPDLVWE
jgi:hypothetical protein